MKIKIKDGKIGWSNASEREQFYQRAEGKYVELSIQDKPSQQLRNYFEGCLVPVYFYTHPEVGWETFRSARNSLKKEFLPKIYDIGLDGLRYETTPSLADLNREKWENFINAITDWMIENGVNPELINSDAYKQWRDANPFDRVYPPLEKLIESYKLNLSQ